jgi:hypothetical protein
MRVACYYKLDFLQAVFDEFFGAVNRILCAIGPGSVLLTLPGHPDKATTSTVFKILAVARAAGPQN